MEKVQDYEVLQAGSAEQMTELVRTRMAEGWQPIGGVAGSEYADRWTNERKGYEESETYQSLFQAVVKYA